MRLLIFILLTGCAGEYPDVSTTQPYYGHAERVIILALKEKAVKRMCKGARACSDYNDNRVSIIYQEGDLCALEHEKKHLKYGPKHSWRRFSC